MDKGLSVLAGVKYVITLDTDTQLPRDAARQFVGTMAHPLNRPVYDAALQRVTRRHRQAPGPGWAETVTVERG